MCTKVGYIRTNTTHFSLNNNITVMNKIIIAAAVLTMCLASCSPQGGLAKANYGGVKTKPGQAWLNRPADNCSAYQ